MRLGLKYRLQEMSVVGLNTSLPYLLEDLRSATGASIAIFQQKNMRVYPKGMGEKPSGKKLEYPLKDLPAY